MNNLNDYFQDFKKQVNSFIGMAVKNAYIQGRKDAINELMERSEQLLCENLIYQQMEDIAEQVKEG